MKASVYHIQLNVGVPRKSLPFYRAFLTRLGYRIVDESRDHLGASAGNGTTDLWVVGTEGKHSKKPFHRKSTGLNHIAFRVPSRKAVDGFAREFLRPRKIKTLYRSPRLFPEYSKDYYAVYFEDPDRLKLEIVHFSRKKERDEAADQIRWTPMGLKRLYYTKRYRR